MANIMVSVTYFIFVEAAASTDMSRVGRANANGEIRRLMETGSSEEGGGRNGVGGRSLGLSERKCLGVAACT